jgi:hypothetical protein
MTGVGRLQDHRLGGWKMTTTLKHANAKGWHYSYVNNRAADQLSSTLNNITFHQEHGFPRGC